MTVASEVARWSAGLRFEDLPPAVVEDCRLRLLDTMGVALAAAPGPIGRSVTAAAAALGSGDEATVIGSGEKTSAALAALVNGTLAHALDFDDTHNASVMHPSAPTVAASLAAAEAVEADGRALIVGLAIGNEIGCRLGLVTPGAFHDAGLHPTSVLGTPAAVASVSRIWRLTPEATTSALGISGSQAAGILEAYSDGTWSKTLHPGWAAQSAIVAARLAEAGFTGPSTVFEGRYGIYAAFLAQDDGRDFAPATDALGERWELLDTAFKLYPCAHSIHPFVEAALALRSQHDLTPDLIREVVLEIPVAFIGQIAEPRDAKLAPRTPTHARASVFFAVAAALIDGHVSMSHYGDEAIRRADLLALGRRVRHQVDPQGEGPIRFSGTVSIALVDGRTLRMKIDDADGTGDRRLSADRVIAKFRATAGIALDASRLNRIVELVQGLAGLKQIGALTAESRIQQ